MSRMFEGATSFNQCLSTWAGKTPNNVDTAMMLTRSGCPSSNDPDPTTGPWCQNFNQGCFAPGLEPSQVPSESGSMEPSSVPSGDPSSTPSSSPSADPSSIPSLKPSISPSSLPSSVPSLEPSTPPSNVPTMTPSTTFAAIAAVPEGLSLEEVASGKLITVIFLSKFCLFHRC